MSDLRSKANLAKNPRIGMSIRILACWPMIVDDIVTGMWSRFRMRALRVHVSSINCSAGTQGPDNLLGTLSLLPAYFVNLHQPLPNPTWLLQYAVNLLVSFVAFVLTEMT